MLGRNDFFPRKFIAGIEIWKCLHLWLRESNWPVIYMQSCNVHTTFPEYYTRIFYSFMPIDGPGPKDWSGSRRLDSKSDVD